MGGGGKDQGNIIILLGGRIRASIIILLLSPMIKKFGTGIRLDVFYTMVIKEFVTSSQ